MPDCAAIAYTEVLTLGRFDVVDVVESNDLEQLERAALIIRGYGHGAT